MITNSDCTIYSRIHNPSSGYDEWEKQYIPQCWWFCDTKSEITGNGMKTGDLLTVRIPDLTVIVKKGDYILKGDCEAEIQTVKDLPEGQYFKVTSTNYDAFGESPHIKVVAV